MSIEHTTRAITENKFLMQTYADKKTLEADIAMLKKLKASDPNDSRASDYNIKQKEYELSQIERRIAGKDYASVKTQCEQYFVDNSTLFERNQIIAETRAMLAKGQTVNEWPHLAAVFLLDHEAVREETRATLIAALPPKGEEILPPKEKASPVYSPNRGQDRTPKEKAKEQKPKNEKQPAPLPRPDTPQPIVKLPETITAKESIIFKDGAYYLTGPKGKMRKVDVTEFQRVFNIPADASEKLKQSVGIFQDFLLLLNAYLASNPKEKAKVEATLAKTEEYFTHPNVQMGKSVLDVRSLTQDLFDNFWRTFSDTDLKQINDAFDILNNASQRKLKVLQFIRKELKQSDIALQDLMARNMKYFGFPSDDELMRNGDLSPAGLGVSGRQSVENVIRKSRAEAASDWNKNHEKYIAQFRAQFPGSPVDEEKARQWFEKILIVGAAKREIVYQKLYNDKTLSGELAMIQDILGADSWKMSDRSWEFSQDVAGMIAFEAVAIAAGVVTAGAGTAIINTLAFGKNAWKGTRALEAYNAASKTKKVLTTSARILGGGVGFEAGAASTRSYMENGDFTSMHSTEGYVQSIAMMGTMSAIGKLISSGKLGTSIQMKEGAGFAKNILPFTGQVVLEGTAIFGAAGVVGGVVFNHRDNWTLEQMAQAMMMVALFKGATSGRYIAKKGTKGEIKVEAETPTQEKRERSASSRNEEGELKWVKEYHLKGNSLLERVQKLGGEKKIEIEGLPGYKIGKTPDGRMFEVEMPNGNKTQFYADELEVKITQFYNEGQGMKNAGSREKDAVPNGTFMAENGAYLTREITATDVRRARNLLKKGEYPQFIAQDGSIWSIRAVKGRSGAEMVEIGPLGQPSQWNVPINEFVDGLNRSIQVNRGRLTPTRIETPSPRVTPESPSPSAMRVTPESVPVIVNGWGVLPLEGNYRLHVSPDKATFRIEDTSTGTFRSSSELPISRLEGELQTLRITMPSDIYNQILRLEIPTNTPSKTKNPPKTEVTSKSDQGKIEGLKLEGAAELIPAKRAVENIQTSEAKVGEKFSSEWIEKIAKKLGKPIGWVADQSVGPLFRMVTGNNPSSLGNLLIPQKGWTGVGKTYMSTLVEHWKHPVKNGVNLLVAGDKEGGFIGKVFKNIFIAGGITALDYYTIPNDKAVDPERVAQNYYEVILLGWLGVVLMETDVVSATISKAKGWISDRLSAKKF